MARIIQQVTKSITREELSATICDICGEKTEGDTWMLFKPYENTPLDGIDWECHVTIKLEQDYDFGYDGGTLSRTVEFDLCPKCFETRLVSWMKANGARPIRTNNGW